MIDETCVFEVLNANSPPIILHADLKTCMLCLVSTREIGRHAGQGAVALGIRLANRQLS